MRVTFFALMVLVVIGCERKYVALPNQDEEVAAPPVAVAKIKPAKVPTWPAGLGPDSLVLPKAEDEEAQLDEMAQIPGQPQIKDYPEQRKKIRASALEWYRRTSVEVFDQHGNTKAPWSAKAREALESRAKELAIYALTGQIDYASRLESFRLVRAATDTGADDPLMLYWSTQLEAWTTPTPAVDYQRVLEITKALNVSQYPDVRKLHAAFNLVFLLNQSYPQEPVRAELSHWENRAWELFEAVASSDDPIARSNLNPVADSWVANVTRKGRSRVDAREEVVNHLRKSKAAEYELLIAEAQLANERGGAARGEGVASTVTPEGWQKFFAEGQRAKIALEKAWKLNPDRWEAPAFMLLVGRNLSFKQAEMNIWFDRAMRSNPDNFTACSLMLDYLLPKWHGSTVEYLGFGWQCVKTENWSGHIPLAPVFKHMSEVRVDGKVDDAATREFYADPLVWRTIQRAFVGQLRHSDDPYLRAEYARLACFAEKYEVAKAQFDALGEDYPKNALGGEWVHQRYREQARSRAK